MAVDNEKLLDAAIELVMHKDSFELIKSIEKIAKNNRYGWQLL